LILEATHLEKELCEMTSHRKRLKHYNIPGDAHFLTFSCFKQMPLLDDDLTRTWVVESIERARRQHTFDLWAWVLMPEHVHLLVYPRHRFYRIDKILASIKTPVGHLAIRRMKREAPEYLEQLTVVNQNRTYRRFWQAGAGYDRNIDDIVELYQTIEYIHDNPVRRGLVERSTDWRWSSAQDWAGVAHPPISVDRSLPYLIE
jgi:putative transposase